MSLLSQDSLTFNELRSIRERARILLRGHERTLDIYRCNGFGFVHRFDETLAGGADKPKGTPSGSSTSTCIQSLLARDLSFVEEGKVKDLVNWLFSKIMKGSAGLADRNPFTVGFMLEAALSVAMRHEIKITPAQDLIRKEAIELLQSNILKDRHNLKEDDEDSWAEQGGANIKPYPPTAFLTQLVIRVLQSCNAVTLEVERAARTWARHAMEHELALLLAKDELADSFALAYSAITFARLSHESMLTPQEKRLLSFCVQETFRSQRDDGTWPRSRPLFHYQKVGNAYCFDYEMLTQLLMCPHMEEGINQGLHGLVAAFNHLENTQYDVDLKDGTAAHAWASGHHPQLRGPESWSTASAYHYLHLFERHISRLLRNKLFARLGQEDAAIPRGETDLNKFGEKMWDSPLKVNSDSGELKTWFKKRVLTPIVSAKSIVENGGSLPKNVDIRSLLLYGPPGTSKTTLANEFANVLGWPLLKVDPSHILVAGWNNVHAEAIQLLDQIADLDSVVVLLDEFDEVVRTRSDPQADPISRFFTTAMLPKLIRINDERRIVFLMATNYVNQFDGAIKRQGRFDAVVPVLPPAADVKVKMEPLIAKLMEVMGHEENVHLRKLTYQETQLLIQSLGAIDSADLKVQGRAAFSQIYEHCTMQTKREQDKDQTWHQVCEEDEKNSKRVPGEI